jgi:hypothetical protein
MQKAVIDQHCRKEQDRKPKKAQGGVDPSGVDVFNRTPVSL